MPPPSVPLDAIRQPALLYDTEGRIVAANDLAEAVAGRPLVGLTAHEICALLRCCHPDGTSISPADLPISPAFAGEQIVDVPLVVTAADGRTLDVVVTASPIREGSGVAAVLAVLQDVTVAKRAEAALHESEERFRSVLDNSRDVLVRFNLQTGRYEYVSPSVTALVGYSPDEFVNLDRETALAMVHPDDVHVLRTAQARSQETGDAEAEYRQRAKSGEWVWVSNRMSTVRDDAGRPLYRINSIRDITERKWAEAALLEYAENLRRSNEDLERFAYVSSHDLQEPLRSIVSFSQLLERRYKGQLDADADDYINFIVEGGTRMQTLIQDLLAFSRVNTTRQDLRPTDAEDVMASVERSLAVPLLESGAMITHDPMPVVLADPLQLEQVFSNLVTNAVKFRRPQGPLRIHVGARRMNGCWEFWVRDNGIGIEAEYLDQIFVIFKRLHTKDAYPGTGIGLAIVKRIIDRHGGRVWVESAPGEGSTFFFTLPAA